MAVSDSRFAAYCERRATHVRKIMMSLSASRGDSLVIELEDFERAIDLLVMVEQKMGKTFGGLGASRYSDSTETIKNYIQGIGVTTRKILLAKFYRDIDSEALKKIEATLVEMGVIQVGIIKEDPSNKFYKWISDKKPVP